jgi:CRISPR-associated protein Cmr4
MNVRLLFLHALSPIHCGTGQAVGGIDLPIAREKPTNIPLVPGSSLKGTLRARSKPDDGMQTTVFGPDTEHASDHAGSVQFSDANLVFLPVRSVCGTFAWTTSPYLLRRLKRDAAEAGARTLATAEIPKPTSVDAACLAGEKLKAGDKVVFEDFDFKPLNDRLVSEIANEVARYVFAEEADRVFFTQRVCVVHDDVMSVLLRTSMEVVARNRLNPDTKTVEDGALWTEEALPIESILAGVVVATPVPPRRDSPAPAAGALLEYIEKLAQSGHLQIGGKSTVGRGLCRITVRR